MFWHIYNRVMVCHVISVCHPPSFPLVASSLHSTSPPSPSPSGKHLAQHCRMEYPPGLNLVLWIIAEIEIVASDIPEGTHVVMGLCLSSHDCTPGLPLPRKMNMCCGMYSLNRCCNRDHLK